MNMEIEEELRKEYGYVESEIERIFYEECQKAKV